MSVELFVLKSIWSVEVQEYFVKKGNLKILKKNHDVLHEEILCEQAAAHGQVHVLKYAAAKGCTRAAACVRACEAGHLDCLKHLHDVVGCTLEGNMCDAAAKNGRLNCLKYMHENGCELGNNTFLAAAANGHWDCMNYMFLNGSELDKDKIKQAAEYYGVSEHLFKH